MFVDIMIKKKMLLNHLCIIIELSMQHLKFPILISQILGSKN